MIVESLARDPIILVRFDGFEDSKDEVLFKSSPRFAKAGVYTSRKDIPRYEMPNLKSSGGQLFTLFNSHEKYQPSKGEKTKVNDQPNHQLSKLHESLLDQNI